MSLAVKTLAEALGFLGILAAPCLAGVALVYLASWRRKRRAGR